jgi:hypothetical protein
MAGNPRAWWPANTRLRRAGLAEPVGGGPARVTLLHDTYFDHVCGVGGRLAWRVVLVGGVA